MTWNNASHTPMKNAVSGGIRYPEKLVWGASMIWEGADEADVSPAPAAWKQVAGRGGKAAPGRLVHAVLSAFVGLGR